MKALSLDAHVNGSPQQKGPMRRMHSWGVVGGRPVERAEPGRDGALFFILMGYNVLRGTLSRSFAKSRRRGCRRWKEGKENKERLRVASNVLLGPPSKRIFLPRPTLESHPCIRPSSGRVYVCVRGKKRASLAVDLSEFFFPPSRSRLLDLFFEGGGNVEGGSNNVCQTRVNLYGVVEAGFAGLRTHDCVPRIAC